MFNTLAEALAKGRGREIPFRCPVHGDRHASASVNRIKGFWNCYACGAHGRVEDEIDMADYEFGQLIKDLVDVTEARVYSESWLDQYASDRHVIPEYWLGRFSERACRHFRLGYDWLREQPCYPARDAAGRVRGVIYRQLDAQPKYLYPAGFDKSTTLFNYTPARREVVYLVEGAADAIACWDAGFPDAFGLYGSTLSDTQIALIQRTGAHTVVNVLDNDSAGRQAWLGRMTDAGERLPGIERRLVEAGFSTVSVDWSSVEAKDIGEVEVATRREILGNVAL